MQGEIISQLIYKLIERQENLNPDTYLLSLYLDTQNKSRNEITSHINSMLTTSFKSNDELVNALDKKKGVLETINLRLSEFSEFSKGLVIFAKFNSEITDLEILNTIIAPKDDLSIRKVFNIGQLLDIQSKLHRALIVEMHIKDSKIFYLNEDRLEILDTVESHYSQSEDREFQANFSSSRGGGTIQHGKGMQNKANEKREDMKHYWQDVYTRLKELAAEKEGDYDYVVVYHTPTYNFYKEAIAKDISLLSKDYICIDSVNSSNNGEIIKHTTEIISKYNRKKKRDLYNTLSKEIELISKDLKQIVDASRDGNIDMLFINPELIVPGFVGENNFVYLEKETNERDVNNIIPRLIQRVIETSGKVVIYNKPVLARLRFKITK